MATLRYKARAFGLARVRRELQRLRETMAQDVDELLDVVGQTMEGQVKNRILREKESPSGKRWKPLSPAYEAYKSKARPGIGLLQFKGGLADSIQHVYGTKEVEVGSNLIYAASHQYGDRRRRIPARPYLGLSRQNQSDIRSVTEDWLEDMLRSFR